MLFCFARDFFFCIWYGGGEDRSEFLLKGETGGILVLIRWTRFCENYYLGKGFRKTSLSNFRRGFGRIGKKKKGSGENEFLPILLWVGLGFPIFDNQMSGFEFNNQLLLFFPF